MSSDELVALRELSEAATPGPWRWEANGPGEGDISLGRADDPVGEHHVLTPYVCEACSERGARCLGPSEADARLIEAAVNYVRGALAAKPEPGLDVERLARALNGFDTIGELTVPEVRAAGSISRAKALRFMEAWDRG